MSIKPVLIILATFTLGLLILLPVGSVTADEEKLKEIQEEIEEKKEALEDTDKKIGEIKSKADQISQTLNKLSGQLNVTQGQVNELQGQINTLNKDIENYSKKLAIQQTELSDRIEIRDRTLRGLYITNRKPLFELLLSRQGIIEATRNTAYHFQFIDSSESLIGSINNTITQYESNKIDLEEVKNQVETQKKEMQAVVNKLASQVNSTQGELSSVSQQKVALQQQRNEIQKKLSDLSAQQASLLQEKTETFSTSVGDVPTTGDPNSRADYNPGFTKAFAAFSFGAPHRKGMSQYGAKGRAEEGQSYEDILKGYYGNVEIIEPDLPDNIRTSSGTMELDGKYLYGLAEMPASWPMEALKAQAIAARTYAMSYVGWRAGNTNPGGQICTTESCQVWSSSKASSSSAARWHDAVKATEGKIMVGKDTGEKKGDNDGNGFISDYSTEDFTNYEILCKMGIDCALFDDKYTAGLNLAVSFGFAKKVFVQVENQNIVER